MAKRTYDTKCFELAKAFAADLDGISDAQVSDLASTIQEAIEDWIGTSYVDPGTHQVAVQ